MKKILVVLIIACLFGCAAKTEPQPTREESLQEYNKLEDARTRTYKGFAQEKLITAAADALSSFGEDYKFSHNPTGFTAERSWSSFRVVSSTKGKDYWYLETSTSPDGLVVKSKAFTSSQSTSNISIGFGFGSFSGGRHGGAGVGVGVGTDFPTGVDKEASESKSPALFDLFYNRLGFMLGLTKELKFCSDVDPKAKSNPDLNPLCAEESIEVPEKANQPPEVIQYYKDLLAYNKKYKESEAAGDTIAPQKPVRPW